MSEVKAPDIIEMRREMNSETKKQRLEAYTRLAQEWKLSGMTQAEFARRKDMSLECVKYRIRMVRETAPEMMSESALMETEFAAVPKEHLNVSERTYEDVSLTDQPVLVIQSTGACLQATNQIEPYLLKTALEVMLAC